MTISRNLSNWTKLGMESFNNRRTTGYNDGVPVKIQNMYQAFMEL